jgi:hypothetical protein
MKPALQALPLLACLVGCGEVANVEKRADAGATFKDAAVRAKEAAASVDARNEVGTDAASDADADGGPCPLSQPTVGGRCTTSLECEYGSDPSIECDTLMGCVSGVWTMAPVRYDAGCGTTSSASCPATFSETIEGAACSAGLECYYPEARCWCLQCPGPLGCPAPNLWNCDIAVMPSSNGFVPADAACPEPRPRLGTPCSTSDQTCQYGGFCEQQLVCHAGAWLLLPCITK